MTKSLAQANRSYERKISIAVQRTNEIHKNAHLTVKMAEDILSDDTSKSHELYQTLSGAMKHPYTRATVKHETTTKRRKAKRTRKTRR